MHRVIGALGGVDDVYIVPVIVIVVSSEVPVTNQPSLFLVKLFKFCHLL